MRLKVRMWLKYAMPVLLLVLSFLYGFWLRGIAAERGVTAWQTVLLTSEPDRCALCGNGDGPRYHAPCLVNLSTGEVGEMQVYDHDALRIWEISSTQQTGTFSLPHCAGPTAAHTCHVELPRETKELAPEYF